MLKYLLSLLAGYLFGSISSSVLLSRALFHTDVREYGSGNAGATNAARVFGMGLGVLTFLCDGLKTAASVYLGQWLAGETGFALAGAACLIGHCWPLFFSFRGGKGVTVGAILALLIDWRIFLGLVITFFALYAVSHTVSVCSVGSAAVLPLLALLLRLDMAMVLLTLFTGALVVVQHRSNLVRLAHHQEPRFHAAKHGDAPRRPRH